MEPKPLLIRRSGPFERVTFLISVVLGSIAVFTPWPVSAAIERAAPSGSTWLFAIMGLSGLGGLWITRGFGLRREVIKSIAELRLECRAECYALIGTGLSWGSYALAVFTTSGVNGLAAGSIGLTVPIAAGWRLCEVYVDFRRVDRALERPVPVQFESLSDPDGGE